METPVAKRRKVLRRLLWLLVALIVVLVSLPVWFPWVLRPVLKHYGFGFGDYERAGLSRFTLRNVTVKWGKTQLKIDQFNCVLPSTWVWKKASDRTNAAPFFILSGGELLIIPSEKSDKPRSGNLDRTLNQIVHIAKTLDQVSPIAEFMNCRVLIGSNVVQLPEATLQNARLDGVVRLPRQRGEISITGDFRDLKSPKVTAAWNAYEVSAHVDFTNTASAWALAGDLRWLTNQAIFMAEFPTNGWWPVRGRLESTELKVPAQQMGLRGYEDLTASVRVTLASNNFEVKITGSAQPRADFAAEGFPEGKFALAADGDMESVKVREFHVEVPWLRAELVKPIGITWHGELMAQPAEFQLAADLSKLPGAMMTGEVEGLARVEPWNTQSPTLQFKLAATNLSAGKIEAESVRLTGSFALPQLEIADFSAEFADGSNLSAKGSLDVQRRELSEGSWKFSGGFLNRFLSGASYHGLTCAGEVKGPLTNLTHHSESVVAGFQTDKIKPLNTHVRMTGQRLRLDSIFVECETHESRLTVEGSGDLSGVKQRQISATLTNVSFYRGKQPWLILQRPCSISLQAGTNLLSEDWTLAMDSLDLEGSNRRLSLAANLSLPARGDVRVALTNLSFGDFSDYWAGKLRGVSVTALVANARWDNGPVVADVFTAATLTNKDGQRFTVQTQLAVDDALSVNQLRIETGYVPSLSVTGSVPIKIVPSHSRSWVVWNVAQAIELAGTWAEKQSGDFSFVLGHGEKIDIGKPELQFQIEGTPEAPKGLLKLAANRISWQSASNKLVLPRMEDFQLLVELRPDRIELNTLTAKLDGQKVEARGMLPVAESDWKELWQKSKLPDWPRAEGRLELERAQVGALTNYLPRIIAPEGQLSARLELKSGKQIDGVLLLTNTSTHPLGSIAPLREVAAVVRFDGHRATLEQFHGRIGGQPVQANGYVTIPNGRIGDYEVRLQGTNIPVARSPEFLLRGNFDVSLRGESNAPPLLAGNVALHNGLFVQHASSRVWSRPRRPALRPPYFSVTNEPLANWRMDVTLSGGRFLRVRTPVFSGLLSANMQLRGTLGQPVLTGDLRSDSGQIVFPFGGLEVNQGYASFSGSDPQGPTLQINASGRNYRYEVGLEVKGPAETAVVTFSSTPPLTSEQILLMLTAGELPQTEFSFSSTSRAGQVATFLGKDLYSQVFGSNRGEERLIIRSGENISDEGKVTYSVEYRFTDRWSIIGEYDQYNQFNGDLKWRIFHVELGETPAQMVARRGIAVRALIGQRSSSTDQHTRRD